MQTLLGTKHLLHIMRRVFDMRYLHIGIRCTRNLSNVVKSQFIWLVVWNMFLFFLILEKIIPIDWYFSEGWNHQPGNHLCPSQSIYPTFQVLGGTRGRSQNWQIRDVRKGLTRGDGRRIGYNEPAKLAITMIAYDCITHTYVHIYIYICIYV